MCNVHNCLSHSGVKYYYSMNGGRWYTEITTVGRRKQYYPAFLHKMECINAVTQACGPGVSGGLFSNLLGALLAAQCAISPTYHEDVTKNHNEAYDFIVVGAGSSGSALAAKLAHGSDYQVLLIEAGGDPPQHSDIPALFSDLQQTSYDWDYRTEKQKFACGSMKDRKCNTPRGKMLGGCSSINGMMYIRGLEKDYDNWEKLGNKGWGWESVKPYYESQLKRLELEEYEVGEINTSNSTFLMKEILFEAAKEIGLDTLTNTEDRLHSRIGYFKALATIKKGTRNNAARQFLGEVKDKKNLHVMKNAHVGRIIINSATKKVEGVEVWINEQWKIIKSNKEVILSAGAFNTPQILMLSGVGPKDHLEALGIPVIQNLQVGKNLQDHLVTYGIFHGLHKSTVQEETLQNKLDNLYYYLTQRKGTLRSIGATEVIGFFNVNDMKSTDPNVQAIHFYFPFKSTNSMSILMKISGFTGEVSKSLYELNNIYDVILQTTVLLKPKSRGFVQLKSKDPFEAPIIDPNYFSNPDDLNVVLKGLKHSIKMGETKAMKKHEAKFLDIGISECNKYEMYSDDYLKCIISQTTATLYHPVGTAKMGTGDDAVIDYKLKVKGIKGLRVADASIMPTIISANTNSVCMMIGEKAGDIILQDWENKI